MAKTIILDGIACSGKSLVKSYLTQITSKYQVYESGIFKADSIICDHLDKSPLTSKDIDLQQTLIFNLVCDEDDWKIRCKFNNKKIKRTHGELIDKFVRAANKFSKKYNNSPILLNTTFISPAKCAIKIKAYADKYFQKSKQI